MTSREEAPHSLDTRPIDPRGGCRSATERADGPIPRH